MIKDYEIRLQLSKPKTEEKPMQVFKIIKILYPFVKNIVEDIHAAKAPSSEGGKKVTKKEVQDIVFENLIDAIPAIEKIAKTI